MTVRLNPYLNFIDDAREAMTFYQSVLGGEVTFMTFGEVGMAQDPGDAEKVMHSQLTTPDGFVIMGSDAPAHMQSEGKHAGYGVSISGDEEDKIRGYFEGISEGAEVTMPFGQAPWGAMFGMLTDKYGIDWLFNAGDESQG